MPRQKLLMIASADGEPLVRGIVLAKVIVDKGGADRKVGPDVR
jgi:hypothetical protein